MAEILHRIKIKSSPEKVYHGIVSEAGLSKWWTQNVKTISQEGSIAEFGFGDLITKMQINRLTDNHRVEWTCIAGPDEWIATHLFFDLDPEGNDTVLRFGQTGWKTTSDFYCHCNCKWSYFLHSLKSFIEDGHGTPFPDDTKI